MQFNSYEFILLVFPITVLCYFTLGRIGIKARKLILVISGIVVYAAGGKNNLIILIVSMALNFILAELMMETEKLKKIILFMTVGLNAGFLFVFKYSNFVITNLNFLMGKNMSLLNLSLPLGISFFTFQQIAYVIDVYNGKIKKICLSDYTAYILYYPKILMGPITDPSELIDQINDASLSHWNWENVVSGMKLFSFGLFKKMILADTFAAAVSWGSANSPTSSLDLAIVMLSFTFEIYFDFSGYSDMATGISWILNIKLPINFDSPYRAVSVRDFWNRWNMGLTHFLTQYIYIPLRGSGKRKFRTYLSTAFLFFVNGIWYGANWTFLLWGGIYGLLSMLDRISEQITKKIVKPVKWFFTFIIINILWLLFSAESVREWLHTLLCFLSFKKLTISSGLAMAFRIEEAAFLEDIFHVGQLPIFTSGVGWICIFMLSGFMICLVPSNNYRNIKDNNFFFMALAAIAFAWSFICL